MRSLIYDFAHPNYRDYNAAGVHSNGKKSCLRGRKQLHSFLWVSLLADGTNNGSKNLFYLFESGRLKTTSYPAHNCKQYSNDNTSYQYANKLY